jgi:putative flippase GtrA
MYKILLNFYKQTIEKKITKKIILWLVYGVVTTLISTVILFIFVDVLKLQLPIASAFAGELSLLIRFLLNNFFIFKIQNIKIQTLFKFHLAMGLGFIIWWSITNILFGIGFHYILAGLTATLIATLFNLLSNFLYVWKK